MFFLEPYQGNPEIKNYLYDFFCKVIPQNNNIFLRFSIYRNELEEAVEGGNGNEVANNNNILRALFNNDGPAADEAAVLNEKHPNKPWPDLPNLLFGNDEYRLEDRSIITSLQLAKEKNVYTVDFIDYYLSWPRLQDCLNEIVRQRLPLKVITWNSEFWEKAMAIKGVVCYRPENSEDMDVIIDRFLQDNNNPQVVLI